MTKIFADQPDYSGQGEASVLEDETSQLIYSLLVQAGVNSDNIRRSTIPIARASVPSSERSTVTVKRIKREITPDYRAEQRYLQYLVDAATEDEF